MLEIKTTGVEDYLDGSANIKAMIIGGPGAGKTRMASFWPKPIFLDCEDGRGSLVDRNMPYVAIKTSQDMLDALAYLKNLERTPKAERKFQTVVVDTADSFQRKVKDEWLQQTGAGVFTGFDAWGFLDTKMQLLFTRLLNLDYNVLVNVHYKDKQFKDGDNQVREFTLQLQGNISDVIFNDFALVGWLGTYWKDKEEYRGLTFRRTADKPFLKDRFNVTPKWLPIEFSDNDYQALFEAFFDNPAFEQMPEGGVVGNIEPAEPEAPERPVNKPSEGGPVNPGKVVADAQKSKPAGETPLEKKNKPELEEIGKGLGLKFKGNTLKSEMVEAIKKAQAEPAQTQKQEPDAERGGDPASTDLGVESEAPTPEPAQEANAETETDATTASEGESQRAEVADGTAEVNTDTGEIDAETLVKDQLGGETIAEDKQPETQPAPEPPAAPKAKTGPTNCADCGADISEDWNDPGRRDYIRLSFVKFKRYLCIDKCYPAAVAAK